MIAVKKELDQQYEPQLISKGQPRLVFLRFSVIFKDLIKNFVEIKNRRAFLTSFNYNFGGEFRIELSDKMTLISKMKLIKRLIKKIYDYTSIARDTEIIERGQSVIATIIHNLSDEQINDIGHDRSFFEYLTKVDESVSEYVGERYRDIY